MEIGHELCRWVAASDYQRRVRYNISAVVVMSGKGMDVWMRNLNIAQRTGRPAVGLFSYR